MGRIYQIPISFTAVSAQIDIFEITAAANKGLRIHEIYIGQSSDVGDAQEEILQFSLKRAFGSFTSGSGGTAVTPVPIDPDDAAAGFTAEVLNTTRAAVGTGTFVVERPLVWNLRMPMWYPVTPETRPKIKGGETKILELTTTPADAITLGGYILVEEG